MTESFWIGFEKRAASITGVVKNLRSGNKAFSSVGQISKANPPNANISIAPRAVTSPLPTPKPVSLAQTKTLLPSAAPKMPAVPKPPKQSSRGVSSTNL